MTKIIGLGGKKGHGKDTFGLMMCSHLKPHRCSRVAFADPMYAAMKALTGVDFRTLTREEKESKEFIRYNPYSTPRYMLQTFGTDWARGMIDENIWVELLAQRIRIQREPLDFVIITDVRFRNELDWIHDQGGDSIWVDASSRVPESADAHISENDLDMNAFMFIAHNNHAEEDLDVIANIYARGIMRAMS